MSHEVIAKLEIFTFGNAARRFNNPLVSKPSSPLVDESKGGRGERVIKHIEHYANTEDFVAYVHPCFVLSVLRDPLPCS